MSVVAASGARLAGRTHTCTVRRGGSDARTSKHFLAASASGSAGRLTSPSLRLRGGRRVPRRGTKIKLVDARR
jgi:hypothetical protein